MGGDPLNNSFIPYSNFEKFEPETAKEIYKRLPRQMLVTNSLSSGLHTEEKTLGVRQKYIQINHKNLTKMMVFDVDNPVSLYDWKYLDIPVPNLIIINPKNQHAHMVYLLSDQNFVCRSENGRLKDILIYQAIYSELCSRLNADSRYVQKIMKNPFHNSWNTQVLHDDTYTFEDFSKALSLNYKNIKDYTDGITKRSEESLANEKEGRNCTVFERTRYFAYAALKDFNYGFSAQDAQDFYDAVSNYAENTNKEFSIPLGKREIKATVKSIVNWTLMHFGSASEKQEFEHKDIWGNKSRENSLKTRRETKQKNIEKAGSLKKAGKTINEICLELKRSQRMVEYYLEEYKKITDQNHEIKQNLKKIQKSLRWWMDMQFVISDMSAFVCFFSLFSFVSFFLDSS